MPAKRGPTHSTARAFQAGGRVPRAARTLAILAKADRVEVYRVKEGGKGSEQLDGYPIVDIGKPQDKAFAGKLKAVLYDEKTYDFDTAKACEFMPGVGFRVLSDEGQVDVILCFHCDELQLFTTDGKHKEVEKKHEDFDRARPALVKLAKQAFPNDKEIQALKETKQ